MKKAVKKSATTKKSFSTILEPHINYSLVANFNKLAECDAIIYYFGGKEAKNKAKNLEALVETHALDFQGDELKKSDKKKPRKDSIPSWLLRALCGFVLS